MNFKDKKRIKNFFFVAMSKCFDNLEKYGHDENCEYYVDYCKEENPHFSPEYQVGVINFLINMYQNFRDCFNSEEQKMVDEFFEDMQKSGFVYIIEDA